jgi:hypothetical protein
MVNTMRLPDQASDDVRPTNMSISLVGEPTRRALASRFVEPRPCDRTCRPRTRWSTRLYKQCDGNDPQNTAGINVGTIVLHKFKQKSVEVVTTTEGAPFLPLKDIQCVKIDLLVRWTSRSN